MSSTCSHCQTESPIDGTKRYVTEAWRLTARPQSPKEYWLCLICRNLIGVEESFFGDDPNPMLRNLATIANILRKDTFGVGPGDRL